MLAEHADEQAALAEQRRAVLQRLQALRVQSDALQRRIDTVLDQLAAAQDERQCVRAAYYGLALDDPARESWRGDVMAHQIALLQDEKVLIEQWRRLLEEQGTPRHERQAVLVALAQLSRAMRMHWSA
jgi:hypothetical protein